MYYTLQSKNFQLVNLTFYNQSEAISRIMKAYPDRQLISIDYPSKFNNHHYAFYLGAENDDDPAMFLGQPV